MNPKISVIPNCGNSPKMQFLVDFNIAFANRDTSKILSMVADDVVWEMVGADTTKGIEEFRQVINEMPEGKMQSMNIEFVISHGKYGSVAGSFIDSDGSKFSFCDVYTFASAKADKLKAIKSYIIK